MPFLFFLHFLKISFKYVTGKAIDLYYWYNPSCTVTFVFFANT